MDLYRIDPCKGFGERSSHFSRPDTTQTGTRNDLTKPQFANNDILSSSAWSSVIHQPAQDSEPEDLPSTVDIDAIKEPPTPINASAQTPADQLHGESNLFELSDDQNAGDSGSDSDSDSDSVNSEIDGENAASGADSGSYSDSDSASSHRSSSSSKCKHVSSPSSRSNTPPSNYEDRQQFSVRETNFEQGGLKLKFSALKVEHENYGCNNEDIENSSDSSDSKYNLLKKRSRLDLKTRNRNMYSINSRDNSKRTLQKHCLNEKQKFDDSDSDSSSSSNASPSKKYLSGKSKERSIPILNSKTDNLVNKQKVTNSDTTAKEDKFERAGNLLMNKKNESLKNVSRGRSSQLIVSQTNCRGNKSFPVPNFKLPQTCKLSEDSDDSEDIPKISTKNETKKENNRDTIEKLAQQLTSPGNTSEHLQVINEEDLAAILPDVENSTGAEFEITNGSAERKKTSSIFDSKKTVLSESSSDAEMLPKQDQIVRDAINSIHVDSDVSDDSCDSSVKNKSSENSSSSDEDGKEKAKEKTQYSSNLLEAFVEKTEQLNKSNCKTKGKSSNTTTSIVRNTNEKKTNSNETCRKRGRPPKSKMSSMAEIEAYMRLDCTVSNVSPDSGIQSNSGSPLYHGLQSPATYGTSSRTIVGNNKQPNLKSLSLSQKAVLCASKKNSAQRSNSKENKTMSAASQVLKNQTNYLKCSKTDSSFKKKSDFSRKLIENFKTSSKNNIHNLPLDDVIKVPPYSGSRTAPNCKNVINPAMSNNVTLFQGKRGPGRPKKHTPEKLNGKTRAEKVYNSKIENQLHKPYNISAAPFVPNNGKLKKMKCSSPLNICMENTKKRNKKKSQLSNISYQNVSNAKISASVPLYPNHKEWFRKHKKRKKKDSKEKMVNVEFLKELENLADDFNKRCVIEDKKFVTEMNSQFLHSVIMRSKSIQRLKERNSKKRKHSDRDSESESNSAVSIIANETKTKRRHKKTAIEIPKVSQTNSDQRLPLKKRHYHISGSSNTSNSHQPHAESKIRNDKYFVSSESMSSLSLSSDIAIKSSLKTNAIIKSNDPQKSKSELLKNSAKLESQKLITKFDSSKFTSKEVSKNSSKCDATRTVTTKIDSLKHLSKSDTLKTSTKDSTKITKSESQKLMKAETSKKEDDTKIEKSSIEFKQITDSDSGIPVTPKKRHRLEEQKSTQKNGINKVEPLPLLPVRRSVRCVKSKQTKKNSDSVDGKKKPIFKNNNKNKSDVDGNQERIPKRNLKQNSYCKNKNQVTIKRLDSGKSENSSKQIETGKDEIVSKRHDNSKLNSHKQIITKSEENKFSYTAKTDGTNEVLESNNLNNFSEKGFSKSCKESNALEEKRSKLKSTETIITPHSSPTRKEKLTIHANIDDAECTSILDEYKRDGNLENLDINNSSVVNDMNLTIPTVVINKLQTSNKPQLITPIPSEPPSVSTSPNLKPPAGVFEPTRKLSSSFSRCKKNSIDDVLSKLKEKLKGLESPMKNTSTLIEKIGVSKNESDSVSHERVLRSKRASTEKENVNLKKNKLKDVTVRLRKLSNSELVNTSSNSDETKPKVKRRKIRNRTGFPIKKKKKQVKKVSEPIMPNEIDGELNFVIKSNNNKLEKIVPEENQCPLIVKNEIQNELDDIKDDGISLDVRNAPPILQKVENTSITIKKETMSEDEIKNEKSFTKTKPKKPAVKVDSMSKQYSSNSLIPSRTSARIFIKKQIKAKELKKLGQKKIEKSIIKEKRESRVQNADKKSKLKDAEGKKDITPEIKTKNNIDRESKCEEDSEKEPKLKEETDKDELSDDSVKCASNKKDTIPKRRRKFVQAGLFSDYYKEEKHIAVDAKNRFLPFKSEDHPHGILPPPSYCEDWVRKRQVDFKLPYDLWWLNNHNQLPGRDVIESWKYKRIRLNVYYDVKPTNVYETQACNCEIPKEEGKLGCGDDCINRVVFAECSPDLCPLKERCSNQRIQKHDGDKKLVKFMTTDKGIGVKTEKPIKCGEYILEYVGEVVTDKEFKKRMTSLYKNDIHHYCLNLDGGLVIDGHRMGGDGRFVNHSCEPNCEIQKWTVNGLFRMALFAQRDIEAGEELTYDYNFALFNPEEGQPCRCGSSRCRGVIGGKSQRVTVSSGNITTSTDLTTSANGSHILTNNSSNKKSRIRPRKQIRKNKIIGNNVDNTQRRRDSEISSNSIGVLPHRNVHLSIPVKPLTPEEKQIVKSERIFLSRNLGKIQRIREKIIKDNNSNQDSSKLKNVKSKQSVEFLMQLNALSKQRFIRTRGLAQVEDNPEMTKTLQLASILRTMYNDVVSAKDERDEKAKPFSSLFMTLPSKRKLPSYYTRIEDPIDLAAIEKNILTGVYKDVEAFNADMNKLISNNVSFYGRISEYGIAAVNLRKAFNIAKLKYATQIQEVIRQPLPSSFMPEQEDPGDEDEDVIRCICGLFNDEGMMIQCERCLVWQHCDCVRADTNAEHYLCERCNPREVDYDIPLDIEPPDYPAPNKKHYLTLMRDDLQIRQGDTVYVLRDIPNPETGSKHTFRTITNFRYEDCDIFRVEQLWKTENGEKLSFGHHYLRPHETFHEPSRKFFFNEVMKVSLYETVPLDLIMGRCYVLDINTYCKGRPIDSDPQHMYICEYRVDKAAKLFFKNSKSKQFSICTKNYAFEKYDTRLKPLRTYAPHGDAKPTVSTSNSTGISTVSRSTNNQKLKPNKGKESASNVIENNRSVDNIENSANSVKIEDNELSLTHVKDLKMDKQKQRLNSILLKLLAKKSCKAPLDASYLLDMGRRNRKKCN